MSNPQIDTPTPAAPPLNVTPDTTVAQVATQVETRVAATIPASVRKWLYPVLGAFVAAAGVTVPTLHGIEQEVGQAVLFAATGFSAALATSHTSD